ncbi:hypothetical protein [Actinomycetospora sp. TBRC 11914]|uniref:hypothetical protein n=1 Tax=Actinomycetospora sp. TBRC 11914 TaxID=2729387 RepID=UPI00145D804F|nr:hypothetical protein [Actinomycetospora sp. TBRC 11914]NMO90999.1 hypothetical protein [Actinomycetospora sp. TBRC 11914]
MHALSRPLVVGVQDRVASFWHTDGDLGRDIECVTDMTRSRLAADKVVPTT